MGLIWVVCLNNWIRCSYFVIRIPQAEVLFVIRKMVFMPSEDRPFVIGKLLFISHEHCFSSEALNEIRITIPMAEEGSTNYELQISISSLKAFAGPDFTDLST